MTLGTFRPTLSELVAAPDGSMWTWAKASVLSKKSERYTPSEPTRRTVLNLLLALAPHCYEEELEIGLDEKPKTNSPQLKFLPPE